MRESRIECEVTAHATAIGLIPVKLDLRSRKGWPDRMYLYRGRALFVEFKRPGGVVEPIQRHIHDTLNRAGFTALIVDNAQMGKTLLDEWKHEINRNLV